MGKSSFLRAIPIQPPLLFESTGSEDVRWESLYFLGVGITDTNIARQEQKPEANPLEIDCCRGERNNRSSRPQGLTYMYIPWGVKLRPQ